MMAQIGRKILGVVVGSAVWTVLWNLGNRGGQIAFPEALAPEQPITHFGALLGLIVYSVALSVLAGWLCAAIASAGAGARPMPAVWVLAILHLVLGIWAQATYWHLMPLWYHLIFLALVVPATVYGGWIRARPR